MFFGKKQQGEVLTALEQRSDRPRYWQMVWRRFRKNKSALWAFRGVMVLLVIAILNPFIANDKPIYAKLNGQHHFPVFKSMAVDMGWSKWDKELVNADWVKIKYESVLRAIVPYNANYID
ncbi:MAG: ABC-type microcin C transport system permease subunit YejE, partial [Nonlabens sp.]